MAAQNSIASTEAQSSTASDDARDLLLETKKRLTTALAIIGAVHLALDRADDSDDHADEIVALEAAQSMLWEDVDEALDCVTSDRAPQDAQLWARALATREARETNERLRISARANLRKEAQSLVETEDPRP